MLYEVITYDIAKVAVGSLSTEIDDHLALRIHDESQTWLDAHTSAIEEETTLHLLNMSFAYVKDDKRSNALHRMNAGLEPMLENRRRFVEALRLQIRITSYNVCYTKLLRKRRASTVSSGNSSGVSSQAYPTIMP